MIHESETSTNLSQFCYNFYLERIERIKPDVSWTMLGEGRKIFYRLQVHRPKCEWIELGKSLFGQTSFPNGSRDFLVKWCFLAQGYQKHL